jgi:hypothetical protein
MSSWQVFGLAVCLLTRLPSLKRASANRVFVPAYGCGALPDYDQILIYALRKSAKNLKVNAL